MHVVDICDDSVLHTSDKGASERSISVWGEIEVKLDWGVPAVECSWSWPSTDPHASVDNDDNDDACAVDVVVAAAAVVAKLLPLWVSFATAANSSSGVAVIPLFSHLIWLLSKIFII